MAASTGSFKTNRARVHELVGAQVSLEEYVRVSGVPVIEEALARLNARLAARGAPPLASPAADLRALRPSRSRRRRHGP